MAALHRYDARTQADGLSRLNGRTGSSKMRAIIPVRLNRTKREEANMLSAVRLMALVMLCAVAGRAALAQADADFFRNRTVKLMITFEPGGSYDLYARLAAAHL